MKKKDYKTLATTFTAISFLIVGITGIFMFFHLFGDLIKNLHNILGLFFTLAAIFHVIYNWKKMKSYFGNKSFKIISLVAIIISIFFISSNEEMDPKEEILKSFLNASLEKSVLLLDKDLTTLSKKLRENKMVFSKNDSILQIAKNNDYDTRELIVMILK